MIEKDDFSTSHAALLKQLNCARNNKSLKKDKSNGVIRVVSSTESNVDVSSIVKKIAVENVLLNKSTKLEKPLEKPIARRLRRAADYEKISTEINKWDGIVHQNRKAEQIFFPQKQRNIKLKDMEKNVTICLKTDLEKSVYGILKGSKLLEDKNKNKEIDKKLSIRDIRLRSKEIWKQKLVRQRIERKAALLNKSKSRKYHRILKKDKLRTMKKEFEYLKETEPEAAIEVLNEIEKERLTERMGLRHRKSKWVQAQNFKAKKDKNIRDTMQENKNITNELLEKIAIRNVTSDKTKNVMEDKLKVDKLEDSCHVDEKTNDDNIEKIVQSQSDMLSDGKLTSQNPWISHLAMPEENERADESFLKWENEHYREVKKKAVEKVVKLKEIIIKKKEKKKENLSKVEESSIKKKKGLDNFEKSSLKKKVNLNKVKESSIKKKKVDNIGESKLKNKSSLNKLEKSSLKKKNNLNKVEKNIEKKKSLDNLGESKLKSSLNKLEKSSMKKKDKLNKVEGSNFSSKPDDFSDEFLIDSLFDKTEEKLYKKKDKLNKFSEEVKFEKPNKGQKRKRTEENKKQFTSEPQGNNSLCAIQLNNENIESLDRLNTMEKIDENEESTKNDKVASSKGLDNVENIRGNFQKNTNNVENSVDLTKDVPQIVSRRLGNTRIDYSILKPDIYDELEIDNNMMNLFEDEENLKEFRKEKARQEEENKPKDTDLFLPGWGSWGGPGITISKQKREKFKIKAEETPKRKYSRIGHVIYNEQNDVHNNIRKKMVSEIPYPFTRVQDFEAYMRHPLGRKFVPESEHRKLIAPPVVTKMGAIIRPIDEEALLSQRLAKVKKSELEKKIEDELKNSSNNNRLNKNNGRSKKKGKRISKALVVNN